MDFYGGIFKGFLKVNVTLQLDHCISTRRVCIKILLFETN